MRRRAFSLLAGGLLVAGPSRARAQARDVAIIGVLLAGTTTNYYSIDQLRAVLRESGFTDGENVTLQIRAADGHYERLPALANELVAMPARVIVAFALPAALAAKAATQTIPVVFTSGADPVAFGLVPSLSRPGGNLTGFSNYFGSLGAKRLELLRELVPAAGVVGILVNPSNANASEHTEGLRAAARVLGQPISVIQADSDAEIEAAFAAFTRERVGALLISDDPAYIAKAKLLVGLVARYAFPTIYHTSEFTAAGGLISYGARISDGVRVVGAYVARILRGARPGDLPVQQPDKFYLAVNIRTARSLNLVVPPAVLARADEVIE
jgi:putative tryptophan/tyrosine transport system substrate-binding protein